MYLIPYFLVPSSAFLDSWRATHIHFSDLTTDATIKQDLQPCLDKEGIRSDLLIKRKVIKKCHATARGTNDHRRGHAAIYVHPELYAADKEAAMFALKHELGHIKNNDQFDREKHVIWSSLASTYILSPFFSVPSMILLTIMIESVVRLVLLNYCERRADNFAKVNCTDEELKGGIRYFKASLDLDLEQRTTRWNKILYASNGDSRFEWHPYLSSRISKLEAELKKRSGAYSLESEKIKISTIKEVLKSHTKALVFLAKKFFVKPGYL